MSYLKESFDNAIEEKDPSAIRDQLKEMEDIRVFVEEEMVVLCFQIVDVLKYCFCLV